MLGKILVTKINGHQCSGLIVETEAYRGPDDKACHAYNNRRTKRTEVMFAAGGVAYVYLCYGIHHLMNIVTGPKDFAHAVLIRAIEPMDGIEVMAKRRQMLSTQLRLTNGPGSLSMAMGITRKKTGNSLICNTSEIWLEDRGITYDDQQLCQGPRIGIGSSGEAAFYPWRFYINNNKYVSAPKTCQ